MKYDFSDEVLEENSENVHGSSPNLDIQMRTGSHLNETKCVKLFPFENGSIANAFYEETKNLRQRLVKTVCDTKKRIALSC